MTIFVLLFGSSGQLNQYTAFAYLLGGLVYRRRRIELALRTFA